MKLVEPKLLAEVQEASRTENQQLLAEVQEASRTENQKLLAESRKDNEQTMRKMHAANQKLFEATTEKLQQIHESFGKRITSIEVKVAVAVAKGRRWKTSNDRGKINNIQGQRPEPVRVVSESTTRITPHFNLNNPKMLIIIINRTNK